MMHGVFSGVAGTCGGPISLRRGLWGAARCGGLSVLGLVRLVVADDATCGSAENAMMTGQMPGSAAHQGAFNAPFGFGWCRYGDKYDRNRGASKNLVHLCSQLLNHRGDDKTALPTKSSSARSIRDQRAYRDALGRLSVGQLGSHRRFSHPISHRTPQYRVGNGGIECLVESQKRWDFRIKRNCAIQGEMGCNGLGNRRTVRLMACPVDAGDGDNGSRAFLD
jgi:hypothetical protein